MNSRVKAVLGVLLIFVLGFASGVVGSAIFAQHRLADFLQHPGVALMKAMETRLTRGLALDANQTQQIHGYFLDNLRQHKQLQAQIQPQVQQLNHTTVQQIRAALHPDQQARFDQNLADLQKRFWKYATNPDADGPSAPAQPVTSSTNSSPVSTPATP